MAVTYDEIEITTYGDRARRVFRVPRVTPLATAQSGYAGGTGNGMAATLKVAG